jgi:hypothetical protein
MLPYYRKTKRYSVIDTLPAPAEVQRVAAALRDGPLERLRVEGRVWGWARYRGFYALLGDFTVPAFGFTFKRHVLTFNNQGVYGVGGTTVTMSSGLDTFSYEDPRSLP